MKIRPVEIGILAAIIIGIWLMADPVMCAITNVASPNHPCSCPVNSEKDRVAVIIDEGGIYDTDEMAIQISEYFASVKKDLNIDSAGLQRFPGSTIADLNTFVDALYANENVGYIILIGDDLPVADVSENENTLIAIYESLECVGGDCGCCKCRDVAISLVVPPFAHTNEEKTAFVMKALRTFTDYHNNFASYMSQYPRSVFQIADYEGRVNGEYIGITDPAENLGYGIPQEYAYNTEYQEVAAGLMKKHLVLVISVHGDPTTGRDKAISIIGGTRLERLGGQAFLSSNHSVPYWTNVDEYMEFVGRNGVPALFVASYSCGDTIIKSPSNYPNYCCWPQAHIDTGAWAYYAFGGTRGEGDRMARAFAGEQTIGLALRKFLVQQNIVIGDILAHMR